VLFVLIVVVVGSIPIRMKKFKKNRFLRSMGTTFAGALFVNVAIIHILPESSDSIEEHLKEVTGNDEVFPLANLLVMLGFLTTIFFTRIIATHEHHDDHSDVSSSFGNSFSAPIDADVVRSDVHDPNEPLLENPQTILTD
jgi:solute carrier family 39 (zinc transporter), member 1/2/3